MTNSGMPIFALCTLAVLIAAACTLAPSLHPQHEHGAGSASHDGAHTGMYGSMIFAGIPHTREASGTAWQPDPRQCTRGTLAWTSGR